MSNFKISLTIFFVGIFLLSNGQVSINQIKNSGIKSEEDLKNLGVSEDEIQNLKQEIFGSNNQDQKKSNNNNKNSVEEKKIPVINEPPINQPSKTEEPPKSDSAVYGHSILKSGYFSLEENSDRITPPSNYALGTGDRISITIWGASEFSDEFTLDSYGNITPNSVGRISLKGKTFSQAIQIIKYRFGKVYNLSSSKIAINLTYSKVISVNVVGEVVKPGTYTIPSINSAFNILALADGVTNSGTVRNILIKRNGKVLKTLDLYEFLMSPSVYSSAYLQDGDFIVVTSKAGVIHIKGEVKRNGYYEIKENESVSSLINYAGGFSAFADKKSVNIIGALNNKRVFRSFNLNDLDSQIIRDGDMLSVLKISDLIYGMLEVKGAVNIPGQYKFVPGMKVTDLLNASNGINRTSYLEHAQLIRFDKDMTEYIIPVNLKKALNSPLNKNNIELKEFDVLKVFDKNKFVESYTVSGTGALREENKLKFYKGMVLNDLILELGGFKKEADKNKIEVERVLFNKTDSADSYISIINLKYPDNANFKLYCNDIVNVRTLPEFNYQKTIKINGEVRHPGKYSLSGHNDKLSEIIERAGGLTDWAFLKGAKLERKTDSLGLLLMNLERVMNKSNSNFNYILKPGDVITIPKQSNIVSISGAIGYKNINAKVNIVNSPFHKNRRANFYIKKYGGGYDEKAKKRSLYVVGSNGMVKESIMKGLIKPRIEPGDKIVVNFKEPKPIKEKKQTVDWNRIIENSTVKLTGLLTILVLANSAFGN